MPQDMKEKTPGGSTQNGYVESGDQWGIGFWILPFPSSRADLSPEGRGCL